MVSGETGHPQPGSCNYINETIDVLAAEAPDLHDALERAKADGYPHLILDGKVVDTDRLYLKTISKKGKVIDLCTPGGPMTFAGNIQAIIQPERHPIVGLRRPAGKRSRHRRRTP